MKKIIYILLIAIASIHSLYAQVSPLPRLVKSFGMYPGTFAGKSGVNFNGKFATDSLGTLMISDGTDAGTRSVYAFYALEAMLVVNGKLFMIACDSSLGTNNQLWISDGTTTGTHRVKDIGHATDTSGVLYFGFNDYSLIQYNNEVYFHGNDDVHGVELWKSDGTDTGTIMVKDINTAPNANALDLATFPFGMMKVAGDKLFFAASDGVHGTELWCTDGAAANTHMVKDLMAGATGSQPQYLTAYNNKICFWANTATDTGLFITDGTDTGTKLLQKGIMTPNSEQAILNGKLYFFADSINTFNSSALWVTDGTPGGTKWVSHAFYSLYQFSYQSYLSSFLTSYNGKLYFGAADNLWTSDGTDTGTKILKVFETEADLCCIPTNITFFNGKMYMRVKDFSGRVEICASDGTDSGTHEVPYPDADFVTSSSFVFYNYLCMPLTAVGTKLFFWNTYQSDVQHSIYVIDLHDESVKSVNSRNGIMLYPNPATDAFTISAPTNTFINKVEIINSSGQILMTLQINKVNKTTIQLQAGITGMLVIKTYTHKGIFCNQLMRTQ